MATIFRHRRFSSKPPIVLLDFYDWEITLREVIFSILIVGVMVFLGFIFSGKVEKYCNNKTLTYRQASILLSDDEFKHALKTDVGNAFANGMLVAKEPVSNAFVNGGFLCVRVAHQSYNMHTVVYTTTDSKGHTHTHTRHYWSWDTTSTSESHSETVSYCGVTFPYGKFHYGNIHGNRTIHRLSSNKRDVVYTIPKDFNATIFANFKENTLEGDNISLMTSTIDEYKSDLTDTHYVGLFWFLWIVLTLICVGAFYYADNVWLED